EYHQNGRPHLHGVVKYGRKPNGKFVTIGDSNFKDSLYHGSGKSKIKVLQHVDEISTKICGNGKITTEDSLRSWINYIEKKDKNDRPDKDLSKKKDRAIVGGKYGIKAR